MEQGNQVLDIEKFRREMVMKTKKRGRHLPLQPLTLLSLPPLPYLMVTFQLLHHRPSRYSLVGHRVLPDRLGVR